MTATVFRETINSADRSISVCFQSIIRRVLSAPEHGPQHHDSQFARHFVQLARPQHVWLIADHFYNHWNLFRLLRKPATHQKRVSARKQEYEHLPHRHVSYGESHFRYHASRRAIWDVYVWHTVLDYVPGRVHCVRCGRHCLHACLLQTAAYINVWGMLVRCSAGTWLLSSASITIHGSDGNISVNRNIRYDKNIYFIDMHLLDCHRI